MLHPMPVPTNSVSQMWPGSHVSATKLGAKSVWSSVYESSARCDLSSGEWACAWWLLGSARLLLLPVLESSIGSARAAIAVLQYDRGAVQYKKGAARGHAPYWGFHTAGFTAGGAPPPTYVALASRRSRARSHRRV